MLKLRAWWSSQCWTPAETKLQVVMCQNFRYWPQHWKKMKWPTSSLSTMSMVPLAVLWKFFEQQEDFVCVHFWIKSRAAHISAVRWGHWKWHEVSMKQCNLTLVFRMHLLNPLSKRGSCMRSPTFLSRSGAQFVYKPRVEETINDPHLLMIWHSAFLPYCAMRLLCGCGQLGRSDHGWWLDQVYSCGTAEEQISISCGSCSSPIPWRAWLLWPCWACFRQWTSVGSWNESSTDDTCSSRAWNSFSTRTYVWKGKNCLRRNEHPNC